MENLKMIGKTEEELQKQMQAVRNFRVDIHMGWTSYKDCT